MSDGDASPFSGANAYSHVGYLVGLGPRSIGSDSIVQAREYISQHMADLGLETVNDGFNVTYEGRPYYMENIISIIPGSTKDVIAIGGHYDTKDIPGANDGGSSTGLLLEMARVLSQKPWQHTIWIIYFDGEDTGETSDTMFYGSRHLAQRLAIEGDEPRWLILADMIGDRNLLIRRDRNSDQRLVDYIWSRAELLGYARHFSDSRITVLDDHVPFMEMGVPSCVLIDFRYGPLNSYWHTQKDDIDKIGQGSLKVVGDVIYRVVEGLDSGELGLSPP